MDFRSQTRSTILQIAFLIRRANIGRILSTPLSPNSTVTHITTNCKIVFSSHPTRPCLCEPSKGVIRNEKIQLITRHSREADWVSNNGLGDSVKFIVFATVLIFSLFHHCAERDWNSCSWYIIIKSSDSQPEGSSNEVGRERLDWKVSNKNLWQFSIVHVDTSKASRETLNELLSRSQHTQNGGARWLLIKIQFSATSSHCVFFDNLLSSSAQATLGKIPAQEGRERENRNLKW